MSKSPNKIFFNPSIKSADHSSPKNIDVSETINSAGHAYDNDDTVMPQSHADHTLIENAGVHREKIGEISKNSVGQAESKTQKPLCPVERTSVGNEFN